MIHRLTFESPIGTMMLISDGERLTELYLPSKSSCFVGINNTTLLQDGKQQILEYLAGTRKQFTLPLFPCGSPFQCKVWDMLQQIPYGETRTYGEIAQAVNSPKAARAVGHANYKNPIPILIPCHRVIGANGSLVGYNGGLEIKKFLLEQECIYGKNPRIK